MRNNAARNCFMKYSREAQRFCLCVAARRRPHAINDVQCASESCSFRGVEQHGCNASSRKTLPSFRSCFLSRCALRAPAYARGVFLRRRRSGGSSYRRRRLYRILIFTGALFEKHRLGRHRGIVSVSSLRGVVDAVVGSLQILPGRLLQK